MPFVTDQRLKARPLPWRVLDRDPLVARLFDGCGKFAITGRRDVKKGSALAPVRLHFGSAGTC